ncbi:hypothetical protein [Aminobacter sp. LjRoot7]|uniref:hypothetical protein n=1 Tax=Aminobacter sp. LjRoot7 TaxID=3342335 RepID=UPI003ECC7817
MSASQADLEVRHQDANHALFMVLMECARIVADIATARDSQSVALTVASNIRDCGKSKLANREIADLAFRLATAVRPLATDDPAHQMKRILEQLMLADRWEAQLRGRQ